MTTEPATVAVKHRGLATSTPYPWPYHGEFEPRRTVLVACLDGWWRGRGVEADAADARLGAVAQALQGAGGRVVAIATCPPHSRVIAELGNSPRWPVDPDAVVAAGATSGFYASVLEDVLLDGASSRPELVIAGWGLEGPVHSTLRAANDRGFECLLVPDASIAIDPSLVRNARSMVEFSGGIFGAVAGAAELLGLLGH